VWLQDGGSKVYKFAIDNKKGSWADVNAEGSLVYTVTWKKLTGTLTFARKNGTVTIQTSFLKDGKNSMPFTFTVSGVRKVQSL
jgi:hypothetical protein